MIDTALEAVLFAAVGTKQGHRRHAEPDWAEIHRELRRKHVTLAMLWDEWADELISMAGRGARQTGGEIDANQNAREESQRR